MLRRLRGTCFIFALLTLCPQPRVHAQAAASSAAASHQAGNEYLEVGKAAYEAGRLEDALTNFEQAYELLKTPRTLFRIGEVADKLGLRVRAVSAYQQYLDSVPTTSDRALVEARIRANRGQAPAGVEPPLEAASEVSPAPLMPIMQLQTVAHARALEPAAASALPHTDVLATAPVGGPQPSAAPEAATAPVPERKSHASTWWIVAGVGVLAVGGIIAAAFAMGSSAARQPTLIQGNVGGTVQTLGAP